MFWAAITAVSFVAIGAVLTLLGWLIFKAMWYLQPILVPIAAEVKNCALPR